MTDLTIFTIPKPFDGELKRIQLNALKSWRKLVYENILLVNAEEDTFRYAFDFNTGLIQQFHRNQYGTPLLDQVFQVAQELCDTELMAFVNTDIILFDDFLNAVAVCDEFLPHFLMVGQRTNITAPDTVFNSLTAHRFREAARFGQREGIGASDYFCFRKGDLGDIPPYAIGAFRWDNALMARAINRSMALVDATEAVLALHQYHAPRPRYDNDAELHANDKLVGENEGWLGRLSDATHYLTAEFELRERVNA